MIYTRMAAILVDPRRCRFQTDLAMSTLWLRPNPALGMRGDEEGFDRADRDSYHIVKDGRGEPVNSDTLRQDAKHSSVV